MHEAISKQNGTFQMKKIAVAGLTMLAAAGVTLPLFGQQADGSAKAPRVVVETEAQHRAKLGRDNKPGEGITVHGHWVIDLKDKDGRVLEHHDFYNSLSPVSGSGALIQLLTGTTLPSNLAVRAVHTGITAPFGTSKIGGVIYDIFPSGTTAASSICSALAGSLGVQNNVYCVPGLTSVTGTDSSGVGNIKLTGSFVANAYVFNTNGTQSVSIDTVQTVLDSCTPSATVTTTATCQASSSGASSQVFTETGLPSPISVNPGQSLLITVTLSFS